MTAPELPQHWFRRELGRLVSILSRRFGVHRLELCEDAAQTALLQATQSWSAKQPDNPAAWLYRVAHNYVLDELRREKRDERYLAEVHEEYAQQEVQDDVLRLLFVCADPAIPSESQLVLALKTLCGFSTQEIALRLFQSDDAVHKRLQRARARLREHAAVQSLDPDRVPGVLHMLYLLFNEGYSSAQPDRLIRRELCDEALRLALMLREDPAGALPETDALVALMCFHAARFDARVDGWGGLLLLEEQDRSRWDGELVRRGLGHLARSARGAAVSRFHAEAGVAAEHCLAPSYAETNWPEIVRLYEVLERVAPSPLNVLNRAIALAEWKGPEAGLAALEAFEAPSWLLGYYLWDATLGELHRRCGNRDRALLHTKRAHAAAPTNPEKALLERRLNAISGAGPRTGTAPCRKLPVGDSRRPGDNERVDQSPRVTDRHRAHFARIAEENRTLDVAHLTEVMALTAGERIAGAIALSDAYLQGRPSPDREAPPPLAARWRALHDVAWRP